MDFIKDFFDFNPEAVKDYLAELFLTIIVTYGVIYLVRFLVHQLFKRTNFIDEKKEQTIESVIKNTSHYIAFFIIVFAAIQPFVKIKDLLLAGGVIGAIVGFGAQSAIKDILYGFFFLFESQFKKGDFVRINEELEGGTVEELGFRALKIRKLNGMVTTYPNGEIRKVVNGNIESRRIFESVIVSFRQDPKSTKVLLQEVCDELNTLHDAYLKRDRNGEIVEEYKVQGLSSLDSSPLGYKFTIVATVNDFDYITAVQEAKEILAQKMFDNRVKMPEQTMYHAVRYNYSENK